MFHLTSLKEGQNLEHIVSDLEHALVILEEVSDKFRCTPSDLGIIEGQLLKLIVRIEDEIDDNERQGLGNVA